MPFALDVQPGLRREPLRQPSGRSQSTTASPQVLGDSMVAFSGHQYQTCLSSPVAFVIAANLAPGVLRGLRCWSVNGSFAEESIGAYLRQIYSNWQFVTALFYRGCKHLESRQFNQTIGIVRRF